MMTSILTTFETLDDYLGLDFSDDYWSDEGVGQAQSMLRELSAETLVALGEVWEARPETWQVRCAQIVSHGEPRFALEVLFAMVRNGARDVRMAALDSLRDIDLGYLGDTERRDLESRAREMLGEAGRVEMMVIRALLLTLEDKEKT